ncbi:MAG: helicase-related protein, partial [Candidatus Syntropharchaeia archaeon]
MYEGKVIKGSFVNEPVKVLKLEDLGEIIHLTGYTLHSRQYVDRYLPREEFDEVEVVSFKKDFSANAENVFLFLEATRMKYASIFDPLLAMSVSKIEPFPFQIEAVYGYILKQPEIRFLLADDPGAGKTIMAGLVIKELKLRKLARRILIVVPGHLKFQWKREMKDRFGEEFEIVDGSTLKNVYGDNPWEKFNQVITSIDFAKQEKIMPSLTAVNWDLVIVDEAHKMSASSYGNKVKRTQRYRLGERLSKQTAHMLFLTATPHSGDSERFRLFLDLLKPGFFATAEMIEESLKNKDNPLFLRRLKEDLRDFEGTPIFTRRFPKTVKFHLSDLEKDLYNELSRYVSYQYNKALQTDKNRNVAFALAIFQRRMASSVYSLLRSLERREERLGRILRGEETPKPIVPNVDFEQYEEYEYEDMEEAERWKKEEEMETIVVTPDEEELRKEMETLKHLINIAKEVLDEEEEVKLKELKKAINEGFKEIEKMGGRRKILIFTEFRDTLEYLVKRIKEWGYEVNFIHGGMNMEERVIAEKKFRDETEIMVATEAAGEGINLQFCHIMINYDIPWNPNRLEQRMGRIHRIGQTKDVYIFNLVSDDTREGAVLARILDKLEEIRRKLGNDRVFDVIGEIFEGKKLYQLIVEAAVKAKDKEELLKEIEAEPDEEYIERVKNALEESLATRFIDYTAIREMAGKAEENRLVPEYVEEFFKRAFVKAGGKVRELKSGFVAIDSIPFDISRIAESEEFKNRYGKVVKKYPKVTFDKNVASNHPEAEFISFGHPLFEAVLEWVQKKFEEEARMGAVFKDLSGRLDGYIWFYVVEVTDGKGEIAGRKIVALYDNGARIKEINPAILWDLLPSKENRKEESPPDESKVKREALNIAMKYRNELLNERERQAQIKRKYGLRSLEYLIEKLDAELVELYERFEEGEKTNLPIRNKKMQKQLYEIARKDLEEEIEREQRLGVSRVESLTFIRVIPEADKMVESEEIERIGMEIAMEYERRNGRKPEDVSGENLGFDIKSKNENEIRYIEVKSRAGEGDVELTP